MNKIIDIIITNLPVIAIVSIASYLMYYIFTHNDDNGSIIDKILSRKHMLVELILAMVCLLEAYIASQVGNHDAALKSPRFALHLSLALISMVTGFGIGQQVAECINVFFVVVKSVMTFSVGKLVHSLFVFSVQLAQALLVVGLTMIGPLGNWYLIGESQDDNITILIGKSFNEIFTLADQFELWTLSSGIMTVMHVLAVVYLALVASDGEILKGIDNVFKKKGVLDDYEDLEPKDFGEVFKYIKKNTDRTIRDMNLVTGEFGKVPKVQRVPRKQILQELVHKALVYREKKDGANQTKMHLAIESQIDEWLDEMGEKSEAIKSAEHQANKEEAKKKMDNPVSDRDSERKRDHSESDDEDVDKEEESGDD